MAEERVARSREKRQQELRTFQHALERGFNAFDIADELIHYTLHVLELGVRAQFPQATKTEIKMELRNRVLEHEHLKKRGSEMRHGRT